MPLLIHQVRPFFTASLSFSTPAAKDWSGGELAVCYLVKPGIEELSGASAQHLDKLLNQIIGSIDFRVDLTKLARASLVPRRVIFQGDGETGRKLVVKE